MAGISAQLFCDNFIWHGADVFGIWRNNLKRSLAASGVRSQRVRKDSAVSQLHSPLCRASMVLPECKMPKMWSQIGDETVDNRFERNRLPV
jgi:hypothetical protein